MTSTQADLHFGPTHQPCGFTSGVVSQFDGSEGPVIRELLQNSLDAARDATRRAEVRFVIDEIPKSSLPGWDTYQQAFEKAKDGRSFWHGGKPSHNEKVVIERIEKTIKSSKIPILLCIDNGHGLNGKRMDALLTPGNTSKGAQGAGSFGLGHHAAFGASNLRYVIYASKYRYANKLQVIASGHTILATHRDSKLSQARNLAADGYWFLRGLEESAFDGSAKSYPTEPPDLLRPYLSTVEDTGTVVCIAGFNDFRRDENNPLPVDLICRVAAANFSAAVHEGGLYVSVRDKRHGTEAAVDKESLGQLLEPIANERRASQEGQIRGELAYNAWKTISKGLLREVSQGVKLRIREFQHGEQQAACVHVFRRGMWIDSRVPGLGKSDFAKTKPFDAVLMLDQGSCFEELVRSAEGPEHRGVDFTRLEKTQKKTLRDCLADIAQCLRSEVGEREDSEEFIPTGFATFSGNKLRSAEFAPKPSFPAGGGDDNKPLIGGEKKTEANKQKQRRSGVPKPGSVPRYRYSHRAGNKENIVEFLVMLDEEIAESSKVGVRLKLASGSDGTCEQPLPDTWLPLLEVSDGKRSQGAAGNSGEVELVLPMRSGEQHLTITAKEPIYQLELLELDLVKRKPPAETQNPSDGASEPSHSQD